ncbi:MAG TPA: tetratricopeptide repeat protein, partial [Thermomicrobiales bacterium]|nr:tetratricopeptide repeat protein [Thermomicrobiales bacterium]
AGGTQYGTEIANALRDAAAVVLIASDASLASKNVRQEIMLAWRYDRPIIPLILHPLVFPDDVAYWLEGAQWIEVFDRAPEAWVPKLWQALARHGFATVPDTPAAPAATPAFAQAGNLPARLPPILGRDREIEEVIALLRNGRTITLTGPGGTGKTRLALEVGRRVGPGYEGGAWFLDLSAVRSAELVAPTTAAMLELDVPPGASPIEILAAHLGRRATLVVLDNLEQIPEVVGDLAALQAAAPGLSLLMTSRASMQLPGGWVYAVPQLALPDLSNLPAPATLMENPAVRLFVDRATLARSDFQLIDGNARAVAEICHRLDGLPLAIEIAAARTRMLPPAAILTRLGSRLNLLTRGSAANARQQTLRDTIAWSYDLLDSEAQRAFRTCAVFAGGTPVEAAEAVVSEIAGETQPALDLLEHLIDQSLLVTETRDDGATALRMLETLREYAEEQLEQHGESDSVHAAHLQWYLDWIESLTPELRARRDGGAIRAVRAELGNLRAALAWVDGHDTGAARLRLTSALFHYWRTAGPFAEAYEELAGALAAGGDTPRVELGQVASALAWLAAARGDFGEARTLYRRALEIYEAVGDVPHQAETHTDLALVAEFTADYAGAREHLDQRRLLLPPDDVRALAQIEHDLGRLTFIEGEFPEAIRSISGAISTYRMLADTQLIAIALIDLASAELLNGDAADSLAHIRESIALLRTLQDDYARVVAEATRGRAEQLAGDYTGAQATLEQALVDAETLGDVSLRALALYGLGVNATFLEDWEGAEARLREAFAISHEIG